MFDIFFERIVLNSIISASLIAFISGFLGCFLIWKRASSFADAVSHIALPGVAIGILLGFSTMLSTGIMVFITAFIVSFLKDRSKTSINSILVLMSQLGIGFGMVMLAWGKKSSSFNTLLFGDILSITTKDIYLIFIISIISFALLLKIKDKLLFSILSNEISIVEGNKVKLIDMIFMVIIACVISVSIKTIGILLVSSMLIIPPICARLMVNNYNKMLALSSFIGILGVFLGIFISFKTDIPPAPAIVSSLGIYFLIIFFVQYLIKCFKRKV
ncbi:MAG: High-affinity zinc uptake system membrane protein ZnuB [Alphaproteobacteria bacterium ADurb.Bin438]|nr:MAG: High-affinity zinc uptake system membrane protein ZnuB [Alphaproteobacteria bacterium ADurb.Bin438]